MTNKPTLEGISKQIYDCFKISNQANQIEALSLLEKEQLDYSKCEMFNFNRGENHD